MDLSIYAISQLLSLSEKEKVHMYGWIWQAFMKIKTNLIFLVMMKLHFSTFKIY